MLGIADPFPLYHQVYALLEEKCFQRDIVTTQKQDLENVVEKHQKIMDNSRVHGLQKEPQSINLPME